MPDILTLQEYKDAQGITDDFNDTQLEVLVEMAGEFVEDYCNREFGIGEFEERHEGILDDAGKFMFQVNNPPIIEVKDVKIRYAGIPDNPLEVDVTRLDVFKKPGYAYYSGVLDPGFGLIRDEFRRDHYYDITYEGGKAVPSAVKLATVTIVHDLFVALNTNLTASGSQVPMGEIQSVKVGDYSESYNTVNSMFKNLHADGGGIVLTATVKSLLAAHVKHGQSW